MTARGSAGARTGRQSDIVPPELDVVVADDTEQDMGWYWVGFHYLSQEVYLRRGNEISPRPRVLLGEQTDRIIRHVPFRALPMVLPGQAPCRVSQQVQEGRRQEKVVALISS